MRDVAIIMAEAGGILTRTELGEASSRLANYLDRSGFRKGDRVAILMENRIEWIIAMQGIRRAGMFYVPVNWHLTVPECRYIIENSGSRGLLTSGAQHDLAAQAVDGLSAVSVKLITGAARSVFESLDQIFQLNDKCARLNEVDGGAMMYSSGTTGLPKGILRPLSGDSFGALSSTEATLKTIFGLDKNSVFLCPAPIYHAAPNTFLAAVLSVGGRVVVMSRFDAVGALQAIKRYGVTHAQFVPTHFVRMLRLSMAERQCYDITSLKAVIHSAAPCSAAVKRAMIEWLGPIVHEYYSGSEKAGFTHIDSKTWLERPGSVGRSMTGTVHILDPISKVELEVGKVGMIFFEGAVPFEYFGDEDKTRESFAEGGWATFGDLGHLDEDGFLYIADRRSDLIISGGINIYPKEVEEILSSHPDVDDVAVVGVNDEEFGQAVVAFIQLKEGMLPDRNSLIEFCKERVASFKVPKRIEFGKVPRTPTGKLLRRRVTEGL